jgi:hypothetical protein
MDGAVAVDVAEGQDKAGINIKMRQVPVYHIRGVLGGDLPTADPSMPPAMAGRLVQINVTPAGGGNMMNGLAGMQPANPDGSFDIGGLTPGVWTVSMLRTQGLVQLLGQTTVVISNGDVADLKLIARNAVDIAGTVRIVPEAATAAAPAAQQVQTNSQTTVQPAVALRVNQVTLQPVEGFVTGANTRPAQVKDDGSFVLQNVAPLSYRVSAVAPAGGYLKSATLNGQDVLRAGADMSSGGKLELIVSMTAAEIDGNVTNSDGQPATDAIVTVTPNPAQPGSRDLYRQARTRADGSFTLQGLAPGKYRVYAWEELEPGASLDPDFMQPFESLATDISVEDSDKKTVTLAEISKAKAADVNHRAGH